MIKRIDKDWTFYSCWESPFFGVSGKGINVDLPHDFSMIKERKEDAPSGPNCGYFQGGFGCYKKTLVIPESLRGKKIYLDFEGVYMNAEIRFNNNIVKRHFYGYTSFSVDVTDYVNFNEPNTITVNVKNDSEPNSRWYSGSGIYRHVYLEAKDKTHIKNWGIFAKPVNVTRESASLSIETELVNASDEQKKLTVSQILFDAEDRTVIATEETIKIAAGSKSSLNQKLTVSSPHLWGVNDPYLYTLRTEVTCGDRVIDDNETKTGLRSLEFIPQKGFLLNGEVIKLKGGCVHHGCGILGAASYDRAEERKVLLHKNNGYNAIRCAHNPPSPAFLDACDKHGILVIDEAFDCWHEAKNPGDYGNVFDMLWKEDMSSMILRDRNHPSIIMWSTGNEILERDGRSNGYGLAKELADYVRTLDNSRAVTNALCPIPKVNDKVDEESLKESGDSWAEKTEKFAEPLDVVGYNYLLYRYEHDIKKYPNRLICGTETYPTATFENWEAAKNNPQVLGDFVWTSLDYFGEAGLGRVWYGERKGYLGLYPWHTAFCGDFDITGEKRPQSYYRDCVWGIAKAPYIAVHKPENFGKEEGKMLWAWSDTSACWDFPGDEGKPLTVDVYSADDEVELYVNDEFIAKKKTEKYIASFNTVYKAGEIVAVGIKDGKETTRATLRTAKKPASLKLTADRTALTNDGEDLSYIKVEVLDKDGNLCVNAENEVTISVCGAGKLIAVGNGDPKSEEMYTKNHRKVFGGKMLAVVRADSTLGDITVTAVSDGMPAQTLTISVN